jgi:hypothetical protein
MSPMAGALQRHAKQVRKSIFKRALDFRVAQSDPPNLLSYILPLLYNHFTNQLKTEDL